jgi:hypothetical protein
MARRPVEGTGSGSAAYQRIAQREEAARIDLERRNAEARDAMNVRIEQALDHVATELGEIKSGMRKLGHGHEELVNRVGDLERQVVDTRDEVQKRAITPAPSQVASARTAIADAVKSPVGRLTSWVAGVTAAIVLANNIPDGIRFIERMWDALAGRQVQPLEVVIPAEGDETG